MSVIFDFSQPDAVAGWRAVDDVVMGGRSQSRMTFTDALPEPVGVAVFTGTVSLEQGGGFASVRVDQLDLDLSAYDGLRLRVLGDGKRYGLTLRSAGGMGVRFQAEFDAPEGDWTAITLPFEAFVPKVFGMRMPLARGLKRDRITTLGLIISGKQSGPFALHVASIVAYTSESR